MQAEDLSMRSLAIVAGVTAAAVLCASDKKIPLHSTENDLVEITATALADREAVQQALGSDLGGHYILVQVRVSPKDGNKIKIDRDDFVLRTDRDGQRTTPFAPSQIAGRGALIITQGGSRGGGYVGPSDTGYGPYGPPIMNGGLMGGGGGSGGGGETQTTIKSGAKDKVDPILDVLKEKILPEKETDAPVSGLLYFPMEKQKLKDLELIYKTPEGKLTLRFK
jgi:hypothetical protein